MDVIIRGRGKGKTTECIKRSAEKFYYIVCINHKEALRVAEEARRLDLAIPFPLTAFEFNQRLYYPAGVKGLIIDNADQILAQMARVPIDLITLEET